MDSLEENKNKIITLIIEFIIEDLKQFFKLSDSSIARFISQNHKLMHCKLLSYFL